jgi:hypothetical protein
MKREKLIDRLAQAGFAVHPQLDADGWDTGLLFTRCIDDSMDVLSVWGDDYALAARLPGRRDWDDPFAITSDTAAATMSFADAVAYLLAAEESAAVEMQGPPKPDRFHGSFRPVD